MKAINLGGSSEAILRLDYRRFSAVFLLFLIAIISTAFPVQAAIIYANNCSQTSVQQAVNSAFSGDTVMVPAGTCDWSSSVSITKAISLKGAGIGQTIITGSMNAPYGNALIWFGPSSTEATKTFELAGFTIDAKYQTGCFGTQAPSATTPITQLKIHDNRFLNGYSRAIILSGLEFGVFYKNQFQDNYIAIYGGNSEMSGWNYPLTQGGPNYPFFEDNTFDQTVARGGFIVETGRGGRIVFRKNTIRNYGGAGAEVFDAHGVNGSYPVDTGTVSCEYYGNTIGLSSGARVVNHRGGKMIFANNSISGSGSLNMTEYQGWSYCTSQSYPKYQQVNNSFYWNNSAQQPGLYCTSGSCSSCGQYDSMYIQQNRDYWLPASGTEASLPSTCTANSFFATTDTNKIFKCLSTNQWSLHFKAYTYPHPLRTDQLSTPQLSAPANLRFATN